MISVSHAQQTLCSGVEILDGFMRSHGFLYTPTTAGNSSGGLFAAGEFRRANRALELHYRDSLGLVTYRVGRLALSHEDYMWSVLGQRWTSDYPGFSKESLDAFRHLLRDLKRNCADFLSGSDADFAQHVERAEALSKTAPRLP
jgi:hypothetical protein